MLTQERLKQLLHYDPKTGVFVWISHQRRPDLIGTIAGFRQSQGYTEINVDNRKYKAHRLAWLYVYGKWPSKNIDHENRVKNDNRIDNLRDATKAQNEQNKGLRSSNSSGATGVYWNKCAQKWQAYITVERRVRYLGVFVEKSQAVDVRRAAEREHFGEFASAA